MDEVMFTVCNIPKFLEEQMDKLKDTLTDGMNEENLKGYDYAVEMMLNILRQTAAEMDDEILVHSDKIDDEYDIEELDLHDLLELYGCRVVAQKVE